MFYPLLFPALVGAVGVVSTQELLPTHCQRGWKVGGCWWFVFHTCTAVGSPFPSILRLVEPQVDWPAWQTVVSMSVALGQGWSWAVPESRHPVGITREVLTASVPGQCLLLSPVCSGTCWAGWQHPHVGAVPIPVQGVTGSGTQCSGLDEKAQVDLKDLGGLSSNQNDPAIPTHQALQSQPRQKFLSSLLGSIPAGCHTVCQSVLDLGTVLMSRPRGRCCCGCPRFGNLEVLLLLGAPTVPAQSQQHWGALPGSWCPCQLPGEPPSGTTSGRNGSSPSPGR